MISALFLITAIHSTTNLKTYEQSKNFFKPALEFEVVYGGSFTCYKVLSLKMKKESPKRCEPPKK